METALFNCKKCGGAVDLTMSACPACGAPIELGRLTGILGQVCRKCDAYNEPGAQACAACGAPLRAAQGSAASAPPADEAPAATPGPPVPPPADAAVVRTFKKDGGGPATRYVPAVQAHAPGAPSRTPVPSAPRCPRCGEAAGPGQFCARCGQALAARDTRVAPSFAGRGGPAASGAGGRRRARLVLERGEGFDGATFRLDGESITAGRAKGPVVFPGDPCLAPHHATFFYRDGALHVRDEGAPGGVYLRLRGLTVPLRPGDTFVVGDRLLRLGGQLPPPPPASPDGTRRLGAPRPSPPTIVIEERLEGGVAGRVFVRGGASVTIGRAGCAVNLGDDPNLSQAHAELLVDGSGSVRLRDLSSSNGTFVRIPPHAERELRDGDFLRMGREVLRVVAA